MKTLLALTLAWSLGTEAWFARPPLGLDLHLPVPATNPLTREKVRRGRELFFDKRLSRDGSISCATAMIQSWASAMATLLHEASAVRKEPAILPP